MSDTIGDRLVKILSQMPTEELIHGKEERHESEQCGITQAQAEKLRDAENQENFRN